MSRLQIVGGTLPQGYRLYVTARLANSNPRERGGVGSEVDERGRFLIERLPEGEYQLSLRLIPARPPGEGVQPVHLPPIIQNVTVTNNVESQTTLVLDLSANSNGQANERTAP